jgi:hypothetical protein
VRGQINRVPEPRKGDYMVIWSLRRERLSTNRDSYTDELYVGSLLIDQLSITAVVGGGPGNLAVGKVLSAFGMTPGTHITALGTGSGGVGSYTVAPSPQSVASGSISAGGQTLLQPTKVTLQLDVHGPNSEEYAQLVTTVLRDDYAEQQFAALGFDIHPLYCNDPQQIPFLNSEEQWEDRWQIEIVVQANEVVSGLSQEFAAVAQVNLINVETLPQ